MQSFMMFIMQHTMQTGQLSVKHYPKVWEKPSIDVTTASYLHPQHFLLSFVTSQPLLLEQQSLPLEQQIHV